MTILAGGPRLAAPVPLWLAMATTRAAVRLVHGSSPATAGLSGSIARLLQSELTSMVLANVRLAAAIAGAGAVVILLGITLASMPTHGALRIEAWVAAAGPAAADRPGRGIPENLAVMPRTEQVIRIVARPEYRATALGQEVERAIRDGMRFLKSKQRTDGSWTDIEQDARTGPTSLAVLALLAAGEKPDSPAIERALELLRGSRPEDLHSTYAIALQAMVFAGATPSATGPGLQPTPLGWPTPRSRPSTHSTGPGLGATRRWRETGLATIRTRSTHCWACKLPATWACRSIPQCGNWLVPTGKAVSKETEAGLTPARRGRRRRA